MGNQRTKCAIFYILNYQRVISSNDYHDIIVAGDSIINHNYHDNHYQS